MSQETERYFEKIDGPMHAVALALREAMTSAAPEAETGLAWGFPCWTGNERIASIIAHKAHCNLQLFNGNRLAPEWPDRIEGTGQQLRHVKVRRVEEVDAEIVAIMRAAVALDTTDPERVR